MWWKFWRKDQITETYSISTWQKSSLGFPLGYNYETPWYINKPLFLSWNEKCLLTYTNNSVFILCTLKSGINVLVGINIPVGKFLKINKCTGWNKRTGGKIEPKYCLIILILLVNFLLSFEFWSKIEIIAQINKRTGWNKSVLVGKMLKN